MIGRLDPSAGEITLVTAPTARSRPYGVMVNSQGVPFVALFGMDVTPDGHPVLATSTVNGVALVEAK